MSAHGSMAALERFVRRVRSNTASPECELCGATLGSTHPHVVDRRDRRLLCACEMCGFAFRGVADGRFRTVPDRVRALPRDAISTSELQALGVPIGLAFFFRPSHLAQYIGVFPGPAGPTEAELPEHVFEELVQRVPALDLEDDVEALLIRCERGGSCNAWVVPIDVCYELSALMRREWRGIDGGEEGARTLDEFFAALSGRVTEGSSS